MNWAQKADLWVSTAPDSSGHIEETRALEAAAKLQFVGFDTLDLGFEACDLGDWALSLARPRARVPLHWLVALSVTTLRYSIGPHREGQGLVGGSQPRPGAKTLQVNEVRFDRFDELGERRTVVCRDL
ncbi:hypothetical protein NL676_009044 [Syzygium grande]|nr:hypothetical protein NL676_009044 [Syzygium grande]